MKINIGVSMTIADGLVFSRDQIIDLYEDAQWKACLESKDLLWESIKKSLEHCSVIEDDKIIGYARLLGDGINTVLVQDIIVRRYMQKRGIGSMLLQHIQEKYKNVRQIILICDKDEDLEKYYRRNGLKNISEYDLMCFGKIK